MIRTVLLATALCWQAGAASIPTTYQTAAGGYGLDMPIDVVRNNNSLLATTFNSTTDGLNTSAYQSSADLSTGTIHLYEAGTIVTPITGQTPGTSFGSLGDTFDLGNTAGFGGLTLGMDLHFTGTWTASGAGLTNWSFLSIYLLHDGSFDTPNSTAPANVISRVSYGFGPNYVHGPLPATIDGIIGIPGDLHVDIPGDLASLPSRFQMLVVAQILFTGDVVSGSWNADLSHTITSTLTAPEGVTLASAGGGFPTGVSAAPEPASFGLAGFALAAAAWMRRRQRL